MNAAPKRVRTSVLDVAYEESGAIDGKCIHQFVQIVAERGLLTRARRRPVKKTRRTKTAEIRHDHAGAAATSGARTAS